jgi:hypothetical protein
VSTISIAFLANDEILICKGLCQDDDPSICLSKAEFLELAQKIERLKGFINELD